MEGYGEGLGEGCEGRGRGCDGFGGGGSIALTGGVVSMVADVAEVSVDTVVISGIETEAVSMVVSVTMPVSVTISDLVQERQAIATSIMTALRMEDSDAKQQSVSTRAQVEWLLRNTSVTCSFMVSR